MSGSALNTKCRQLATVHPLCWSRWRQSPVVDISLGDKEKVGRSGGRVDTALAQR